MPAYDMPVLQPVDRKWWQLWKPAHRVAWLKIDEREVRRDPRPGSLGMVYRLIGFDEAEARGEIVFAGHMTEPCIVSRSMWDGLK